MLASVIGLFLGPRAREGCSSSSSTPSASRCRTAASSSRRARSSSRCSSGILVTLLASLRPAIRATRVPPIAAVREGAHAAGVALRALPHRRLRAADAARLRGARSTGSSRRTSGRRRCCSGWARRAPDLLRRRAALGARSSGRSPARSAGPRHEIGGAAGALARDNARRNPQRTASTAAALMIGLALVTLVAVLAAGITSTLPRRGRAHLARTPTTRSPRRTTSRRSRPRRPTRSRRCPASRRSATSAPATPQAFGKTLLRDRRQPAGRARCSTWTGRTARRGRIATLGDDGAFVDKDYAKTHNLARRLADPR